MVPRIHRSPRGWLVLGLALHLLTAALVLPSVLSSRPARPSPSGALAPRMETAPERAPSSARASGTSLREDASRSELGTRVRSATEALAQALESPDYESERWRVELSEHARTLGQDALPALQAVLADEQRSVEEHVAATELAAALQR